MSDDLRKDLWKAYQRDGDVKWLEQMLSAGLFQDVPMGEEIADAFRDLIPFKQSADDKICFIYGSLHPEYSGRLKKSAIREVNLNYPNMSYEGIRTALRRSFDPKRHIQPPIDKQKSENG